MTAGASHPLFCLRPTFVLITDDLVERRCFVRAGHGCSSVCAAAGVRLPVTAPNARIVGLANAGGFAASLPGLPPPYLFGMLKLTATILHSWILCN